MKTKYIVMAVFGGVTKQFDFTVGEKEDAIACYKNVRMRAERCKFFSVDSEDDEIWYDLSERF